MKVILLERIKKVGVLGDEVKVAAGFARNYLIPAGKAVRATEENRQYFESQRAQLEEKARVTQAIARERAEQVSGLDVQINARASQEGKLYGSIGTKQIADAVTEAGVAVQPGEIILNEGMLRETGEYQIQLQLHPEVSTSINIHINALTT